MVMKKFAQKLCVTLGSAGVVLGLISGLTGVSVHAADHPPSRISGPGIELFERNHGFAGQIAEQPVFGAFDHEPFGGKIQIRRGETNLTLALVQGEKTYGGTLTETRAGGNVQTSVELVGVKKTGEREGAISLLVDGVSVVVSVVGESFSNGHFHAPTFAAQVGAETVTFAFTGEACFGYSSNLAMLIVGAATHLKK